jgi:hypothetical protein
VICLVLCQQSPMVYLLVGCFTLLYLQLISLNSAPNCFDIISVLLKKFCGEEGEKVDVQKLFGYLGLFTLVALWWIGTILFPFPD